MNIEIPLKGQNSNKIISSNVETLYDTKLRPLIEEYLRGEYSQLEIEEKLEEAKKIFSF